MGAHRTGQGEREEVRADSGHARSPGQSGHVPPRAHTSTEARAHLRSLPHGRNSAAEVIHDERNRCMGTDRVPSLIDRLGIGSTQAVADCLRAAGNAGGGALAGRLSHGLLQPHWGRLEQQPPLFLLQ